MLNKASDYAAYQRFFNKCLREWYYQSSCGASFYYANPPGILFTKLRSTKNVREEYALDMLDWYFKASSDRITSDVFRSGLKPQEVALESGSLLANRQSSVLHIGYDSCYSPVLAKLAKASDTHHIAFCNSYDVAFNTLFNYTRAFNLEVEGMITFDKFRLVTGNLYNLPLILNQSLFKAVILHLDRRKSVMRN